MRIENELQKSVTRYVRTASKMPLVEGQLVSMVVLHFDIPFKEAKRMTELALKEIKNE